jgi:hypothetical protein
MNAERKQDDGSAIRGNLLRLRDGRAVAIYLRNGIVSVADLRGQRGRILTAGEWGVFHARRLAFAQRRGEVEIVSPIPEEVIAVIEHLHRASGESSSDPLKRGLLALLDRLLDIGGWRQLPGSA